MKYSHIPLKIGIIDIEIEPQALQMLVPYYLKNISVIQCVEVESCQDQVVVDVDLPVNHATLCTALLIEGLHKKKILDKVQITNISIVNENGEKTLRGLACALEYSYNHHFDILSMSVGILNLIYAKQLIPLLEQLNHTIIVAAAANDFVLTYPAAFSTVIGVKRAVYKTEGIISVVKNPIDGIEIIMSYTDTPILNKLRREYQLTYVDSNSILVPQVCAEIADFALRSESELTLKKVLQLITKYSGVSVNNLEYGYSDNKEFKDSIPVVLFQYNSINQKTRHNLLKWLQKKFEAEEYSCAILCDFIKESEFENGWYRISSDDVNYGIKNFINLLSDGILFLFLSSEITGNYNFDLSIDIDMLSYSSCEEEVNKLFNRIVTELS